MGKKYKRQARPKPTVFIRNTSKCRYCGKVVYYSRKSAREAAKALHPNDRMSTYRCVKAPDFVDTSATWHFGHLNEEVVKGNVPRSEFYSASRGKVSRGRKPKGRRQVNKRSNDNDNEDDDDDDGGQMPTVAETVKLTVKGLDEQTGSKLHDPQLRARYVYKALKAYAIANSFEEMELDGVRGRVGRISMNRFVNEVIFDGKAEAEKVKNAAGTIVNIGRRTKAFKCLEKGYSTSDKVYHDPIWWVADETGIEDAPAQRGGRKKGSKNLATVDLHNTLFDLIVKIGRPTDAHEVYTLYDGDYSLKVISNNLRRMAHEGQLISWVPNDDEWELVKLLDKSPSQSRTRKNPLLFATPEMVEGSEMSLLPWKDSILGSAEADSGQEGHDEANTSRDDTEALPGLPDGLQEAIETSSDLPDVEESAKSNTGYVLLGEEDVRKANERVAKLEFENAKLIETCTSLLSIIHSMKGTPNR